MTEDIDPIEALRAANPVGFRKLADPSGSASARALFEEITMSPQTITPTPSTAGDSDVSELPHRWVRRVVLVPVIAVAAVGLAAFAWAIAPSSVTKTTTVGCYAADNLNADAAVIDGGSDPIGVCSALWAKGQLGQPSQPLLAACVLPSGALGIFPSSSGEAVCSQMRLATPAQPYPNRESQAFESFKSAVVADFMATGCMSPAQAQATVTRELDGHGLSTWTTSTGAFTADRPCAGLAFNTDQHQVLLVPQTPSGG
jgi:hypothetical protein